MWLFHSTPKRRLAPLIPVPAESVAYSSSESLLRLHWASELSRSGTISLCTPISLPKLPTTAVDPLGATIRNGKGVSNTGLATVMPQIANFASRIRGFMAD